MDESHTFDVVVVGGGPAGATAARDLAAAGWHVLLIDRPGRIKPCGGAIPPRLIEDFDIPSSLLVARITSARMVAPSGRAVDIPIENGFVGMVDREVFDPWLRERATAAGAVVRAGQFTALERTPDGRVLVRYRPAEGAGSDAMCTVRAGAVVGADGTNSRVARAAGLDGERIPYVFAYHEVIAAPHGETNTTYDSARCDVIYRGETSPDFYAWVFPHGQTLSVGTGSARKGFDLRTAVAAVRGTNGLAGQTTLRREGAPLPLRPRRRWDDRQNVVLAGDAAGVVAPASGEGIYYAMLGGQLAAAAVDTFLATGDQRALASARRRFMRQHGMVFRVLGVMQSVWYGSDRRRERFVSICRDVDVQRLTFESYMRKRLVFGRPFAHMRIFFKDVAHLLGLARI